MTRKPLVLCPLDFSESCCGALRYAAAIAEHFQSELVIATVDDPLVFDVTSMTAGEGHLARRQRMSSSGSTTPPSPTGRCRLLIRASRRPWAIPPWRFSHWPRAPAPTSS